MPRWRCVRSMLLPALSTVDGAGGCNGPNLDTQPGLSSGYEGMMADMSTMQSPQIIVKHQRHGTRRGLSRRTACRGERRPREANNNNIIIIDD